MDPRAVVILVSDTCLLSMLAWLVGEQRVLRREGRHRLAFTSRDRISAEEVIITCSKRKIRTLRIRAMPNRLRVILARLLCGGWKHLYFLSDSTESGIMIRPLRCRA